MDKTFERLKKIVSDAKTYQAMIDALTENEIVRETNDNSVAKEVFLQLGYNPNDVTTHDIGTIEVRDVDGCDYDIHIYENFIDSGSEDYIYTYMMMQI